MSKFIKNSRGLLGVGCFVVALWMVVVVSYARQVKQGEATGEPLRPLQTPESCSSSSSGNSSGGTNEP